MPLFKLRDGAELHYERTGSGPPLFLVPGLGGDGRFWDANVAELARSFTVVVHDHRGTARSTLSRISYSVEQMADDALQLIEGLGYERVHWCGHSTGGAMGQVLAIEHPGRIDRLVLSSTWARTDAFFRRLFEVRSLMLRELGPAAYLKASALALNTPSWGAITMPISPRPRRAPAKPYRSRRSCCRASPPSSPTTGAGSSRRCGRRRWRSAPATTR